MTGLTLANWRASRYMLSRMGRSNHSARQSEGENTYGLPTEDQTSSDPDIVIFLLTRNGYLWELKSDADK